MESIEDYALRHTTPESSLLRRIHRETHLKTPYPRMLSGHLQGRLLSIISCMIRPHRILEIGTFTGYSALCLAEGLTENGRLDTLEINPEMSEIILEYFSESPWKDQLFLHTGHALQLIDSLEGPFDLVFIDADKEEYLAYYQKVFEKVPSGGFILADNVLWGGKVLDEVLPSDKESMGIVRFNNFIEQDERVEKLLLPVRDGLMILKKK